MLLMFFYYHYYYLDYLRLPWTVPDCTRLYWIALDCFGIIINVGVVIIIRPGSDLFTYDALLPLGAAFGYALAGVLVKLFPKEVHTAKIQLYAQMTTLIATIFIALITFSFSFIESITDLFLLAAMGISGGVGVILLISGYRITEPSLIASFEYFALPISFALGWIFFMEWPFDKLFPGILGIVLGGIIIAWREGRAR